MNTVEWRTFNFASILLLVFTIISQSHPLSFPDASAIEQGIGKLGYPLKLHIGQTMMIEPVGIAINFVKVVQDSRCPSDVTCVWQGEVTILVNITNSKKIAGSFNLTSRAGEDDLGAKTFDRYRIKLLQVEPYPISAKKIEPIDYTATLIVSVYEIDNVSKHVYVKSATESDRLIVSWNLGEQKGIAVYATQGTTTILRFIPTVVNCLHPDSSACIEATVSYSSTQKFAEKKIRLEVNEKANVLFFVKATEELLFKMYKMKSVVTLGEGSRESNLLVNKIYPDHVDGLNFIEYPLARTEGLSLTLHVGESASNGCTVKLTLLEIHEKEATFLKTLDFNRPCPICLSGDTLIDIPNGPMNIKKLKDGMSVWTLDSLGHKQPAIILKTGKTLVPYTHTMIHIVLDDGRELFASSGHPTADGRLLGDLTEGDILDNSHVKNIERVAYTELYTYDILPSGSTGFYWANGILVGSTLK